MKTRYTISRYTRTSTGRSVRFSLSIETPDGGKLTMNGCLFAVTKNGPEVWPPKNDKGHEVVQWNSVVRETICDYLVKAKVPDMLFPHVELVYNPDQEEIQWEQ